MYIEKVHREQTFVDGKMNKDVVVIKGPFHSLYVPAEEIPALIEKLNQALKDETPCT